MGPTFSWSSALIKQINSVGTGLNFITTRVLHSDGWNMCRKTLTRDGSMSAYHSVLTSFCWQKLHNLHRTIKKLIRKLKRSHASLFSYTTKLKERGFCRKSWVMLDWFHSWQKVLFKIQNNEIRYHEIGTYPKLPRKKHARTWMDVSYKVMKTIKPTILMGYLHLMKTKRVQLQSQSLLIYPAPKWRRHPLQHNASDHKTLFCRLQLLTYKSNEELITAMWKVG